MITIGISKTNLEYLRVLYDNGNKFNTVPLKKFSDELKVDLETVRLKLKKLDEMDYIHYIPHQGAILKNKGLKMIEKIDKKHRTFKGIISNFLNLTMGNIYKHTLRIGHHYENTSKNNYSINDEKE